MKVKITFLNIGLLLYITSLLLAGCLSPYDPVKILPDHPASPEVEVVDMYPSTTTLEIH